MLLLAAVTNHTRAQQKYEYIACSQLPEIIQLFYADYTELGRVYTVNNAP